MGNDLLSNIFGMLQNIKSDAKNLNKSLDDKDPREEAKGDLRSIFKHFGEIKNLMSNLNESEKEQLQAELKQLMSGQEDILEYTRDVNNILTEVKHRIEQNVPTKQKVIENLPPEKKQENVGSLFDNWGSVLKNLSNILGQPSERR